MTKPLLYHIVLVELRHKTNHIVIGLVPPLRFLAFFFAVRLQPCHDCIVLQYTSRCTTFAWFCDSPQSKSQLAWFVKVKRLILLPVVDQSSLPYFDYIWRIWITKHANLLASSSIFLILLCVFVCGLCRGRINFTKYHMVSKKCDVFFEWPLNVRPFLPLIPQIRKSNSCQSTFIWISGSQPFAARGTLTIIQILAPHYIIISGKFSKSPKKSCILQIAPPKKWVEKNTGGTPGRNVWHTRSQSYQTFFLGK